VLSSFYTLSVTVSAIFLIVRMEYLSCKNDILQN